MLTTGERMRAWQGPAVFTFGFRPFFLGAAIWASVGSLFWSLAYLNMLPVWFASRDWHVHELLFGYLPAVIAGFLLTAVPNWTGRLPVVGWPLAALFGLWLAGRAAMLFAGPLGLLAPVVDGLFLVAFAALIWREVLAGGNRRNIPVCVLVTLLAIAHLLFDLRPQSPALPAAEIVALGAVALLLALIGGRIVPSFTRNWMARHAMRPEPAPADRFDTAALVLVAGALALWAFLPESPIAGWMLVAGGLAVGARLARWRGQVTWREPILLVLHLGYLWLAIALILIGLALLLPSEVPLSSGIHALTAGAFGVMTVAVMTRASLGHTGRALVADRQTEMVYLLVNLGAACRVAAGLVPSAYAMLILAGALLWSGGFLLFALHYGRWLLAPRPAT